MPLLVPLHSSSCERQFQFQFQPLSFMITLLRLFTVGTLLSFLGSALFAQPYSFTRIAGSPQPHGYADGAGSNARFNQPFSVAVDSVGNVYVTDYQNHVLRKITPAGVVSTLAGRHGTSGWADGTGAEARFNGAADIAIDSAGNLWVADSGNHVIRKVSATGATTTFAGEPGVPGSSNGTGFNAHFRYPSGIAVDPSGNIYVTDRGNQIIRKITPAGVVSTLAGRIGIGGSIDGTGSNATFDGLGGMTIDTAGNLYVVDTHAHIVRKVTPDGVVSTIAGTRGVSGSANGNGTAASFHTPMSIAAGANGTVYVADMGNNLIRRIATSLEVSTVAGRLEHGNRDGTGTDAQFYTPVGVAVDSAGNVYVADLYNHSIRKISAAGVVSGFAGSGGTGGVEDGKRLNARLRRPHNVTLAPNGYLYITDGGNSAIRMVSPAGIVSTAAGTPGAFGASDGIGTQALLGAVYGITAAPDGTIYFTDAHYNTIRKLAPNGSVTTIAGSPSAPPTAADGTAQMARFNFPAGLALDAAGNLYIADCYNHTIRKMTPDGMVSTVAGVAKAEGSADGVGSAARFKWPTGLVAQADGTLYVTDWGNHTIRRVAADGMVTTIAGAAGLSGATDGAARDARFNSPAGIARDNKGFLYICEAGGVTIRRLSADGDVTTIGGVAGKWGNEEGTGSEARFLYPQGITAGPDGSLYVVDHFNDAVFRASPATTPLITAAPKSLALRAGNSGTLSVSASGGGLQYQWFRNGIAVAGATNQTLTLERVQAAQAGDYTVTVTNAIGASTSTTATVALTTSTDLGRISNLSIRSRAGVDADMLTVGFVVGGTGTSGEKALLIRAVGPTLAVFQVPGFLVDPTLDVIGVSGSIAKNDNWAGDPQIANVSTQVQAFAFSSPTSADAAVFGTEFGSSRYSAQIAGKAGTSGVALAEIYDALAGPYTLSTPRLINVSARTQAGRGADILTVGFVIAGSTAKNVLVRAIGPTLAAFGLSGTLSDPKLELYEGSVRIFENDDWGGSTALSDAFTATGAFGLNRTSRDAALMVTLTPGQYTAQVSGLDGGTGMALVEVYELP